MVTDTGAGEAEMVMTAEADLLELNIEVAVRRIEADFGAWVGAV
jgi:hypothetical protein